MQNTSQLCFSDQKSELFTLLHAVLRFLSHPNDNKALPTQNVDRRPKEKCVQARQTSTHSEQNPEKAKQKKAGTTILLSKSIKTDDKNSHFRHFYCSSVFLGFYEKISFLMASRAAAAKKSAGEAPCSLQYFSILSRR